jgi:hypothetical protein
VHGNAPESRGGVKPVPTPRTMCNATGDTDMPLRSIRPSRLRQITAALIAAGCLATIPASAFAQKNPFRDVFFGEQHVHTGWSFDAYIFGNTHTGPAEAIKYAMGQPIKHGMGYEIKITSPLDWIGVTDHAEYVGTVMLANDPKSPLSKLPIAEKLRVRTPEDIQKIYLMLGYTIVEQKPIKELGGEVAQTVWKQIVKTADEFNRPGKFTAFCAFEWTATPDNRNLHRNIYFKDCAKVADMPFSSLDSSHPEDLWNWMDGQRKAGNELLAIAHNANLSDGAMFPIEVDSKGRPIDRAWAEQRMRNEFLQEGKQIKGQSETHPLLSPNDEFAGFEVMNYLLGDPKGRTPTVAGSYIRQAWRDGVAMNQSQGFNPYKFGVVGGSDSHNSAAPYRQKNFFGGHVRADGGLKERMSGHVFAGMDVRLENPAGLSAIWAEENTRASLFEAMQRKETYVTSGVKIKLRFFGGWGFDAATLKPRDWVKAAYAKGVPMGGDLPAAAGKAPTFVVWAVKDPDSGHLDRIQIIKGWSKNGQSFEKIYDVVWSGKRKVDAATGKLAAVGNTVDPKTAKYSNTIGAVELKGSWTDPEFDPGLDAFYYARVLEIPTPRWTMIQAVELGVPTPTSATSLGVVQPLETTVQERAWTSPIWYTPSAEARKAVAAGTTVADLKQRGAVALDDAQLKELVVGKVLKARNTVTGQRFEIFYGKTGNRLIVSVDGKQADPSNVGFVLHSGMAGSAEAYRIKDGKVVTTIGNTPFEVTVYKAGDRYYGARSNEFGYANYEIESTRPE